jgi:sterol O-acyltransferase
MSLGQFFCVPFVKGLISRGYKYYWVGLVIQHTYQTLYLGIAIWVGVHRQWYWVQAGFLVLRKLCLALCLSQADYQTVFRT